MKPRLSTEEFNALIKQVRNVPHDDEMLEHEAYTQIFENIKSLSDVFLKQQNLAYLHILIARLQRIEDIFICNKIGMQLSEKLEIRNDKKLLACYIFSTNRDNENKFVSEFLSGLGISREEMEQESARSIRSVPPSFDVLPGETPADTLPSTPKGLSKPPTFHYDNSLSASISEFKKQSKMEVEEEPEQLAEKLNEPDLSDYSPGSERKRERAMSLANCFCCCFKRSKPSQSMAKFSIFEELRKQQLTNYEKVFFKYIFEEKNTNFLAFIKAEEVQHSSQESKLKESVQNCRLLKDWICKIINNLVVIVRKTDPMESEKEQIEHFFIVIKSIYLLIINEAGINDKNIEIYTAFKEISEDIVKVIQEINLPEANILSIEKRIFLEEYSGLAHEMLQSIAPQIKLG